MPEELLQYMPWQIWGLWILALVPWAVWLVLRLVWRDEVSADDLVHLDRKSLRRTLAAMGWGGLMAALGTTFVAGMTIELQFPCPPGRPDGVVGRVYVDSSGNGTFEVGEQGVGGSTVRLVQGGLAVGAPVTVGSSGEYSLVAPGAGTFEVRVEAPVDSPYSPASPASVTVDLCSAGSSDVDPWRIDFAFSP
jgi:hypothetical protein